MKNFKYIVSFMALWFALVSCEISQLTDPNSPNSDLVSNPSLSEIQNLVSGVESGLRGSLGIYYDVVNMIGREYWRFSGSEPRYTGDLLGKGSSILDNNTFYLTNPYGERYRVIRNADLLITGVNNTSAALSDAQKKNTLGFAKTIKAYQYLLVLNLLYENGIRIDVADPDNLGPFRSYTEALSDIATLLNEGNTDLNTGSEDEFIFPLSAGFAGFNTPETFAQFNRGLAARVALYRGNYAEALTLLDDSFLNLSGNLDNGAYHFFSIAGGDVTNVLFFPRNSNGETRITHPTFITDAEAGDTRVTSKTALRADGDDADTAPDPGSLDDLSGIYDYWAYQTQSDFIPIIRNEELILIYAEAKIQTNSLTDGATALNTIRNASGLSNLAGGLTQAQLITVMLKERRYSLFGEGHRWVDMRRYNRLNQLTLDRPGDNVWEQFPRPANDTE
jgi:hypothetical protein